ncbi:MAG TPA: hypothetical protein VGO11_06520 [Chthoniobacteraceae bacterium]|jgi:hypothetical protein|nr:hypothetical protein [Chthoniobacteraceae bacterium]
MSITVEIEMPDALADFQLPIGLAQRLHHLLDRQDEGVALTEAERLEAEGLVDVADMLRLLGEKSDQAARLKA